MRSIFAQCALQKKSNGAPLKSNTAQKKYRPIKRHSATSKLPICAKVLLTTTRKVKKYQWHGTGAINLLIGKLELLRKVDGRFYFVLACNDFR